jgi:hypothetical protein
LATCSSTGSSGEVGIRLWRGIGAIGATKPIGSGLQAKAPTSSSQPSTTIKPSTEPQNPFDLAVSQLQERSRESVGSSAVVILESGEIHIADAALPTSLRFLGELRILAGEPEEGVTLLQKAIEKGGDRPSYFKSLGWALTASGKEAEARQPFMTALGDTPIKSADPDQLVAAYFLDRINADEFVQLATPKSAYGETFARFYIGQRLWWGGEREAARDQYKRAVDAAKKSNATAVVINWAGACLEAIERGSEHVDKE